MKLLVLFFLLCSHSPMLWACVRAVWNRRLPRSIDLIGVSLLIYFDLEIAFEAFGGQYHIPLNFFPPFFKAGDSPLTWSFLVLIFAPWLMKVGYWFVPQSLDPPARHRIQNLRLFYTVSFIGCAVIAAWSLSKLLQFDTVWSAHAAFSENFGWLASLLYIPLGTFTFFLTQPESKTWSGKSYLAVLLLLSTMAMLATGERTLVLLPILLLAIFYRRPSIQKIAVIAGVLLALSIVLLPLYRWNYQDTSNKDAAGDVFSGDLARGPELAYNIDHSRLIGTKLLPYPGAGYVFDALMYIPRAIAPFKGLSTSRYYTGYVMHQRPEDIDWGFGVGAIDELSLNFGVLAVFPGLILYGIGFGLLDRAAHRFPVFGISSRLCAVWLFGYDLQAMITLFGVIAVLGALWQIACTTKQSTITVRVSSITKAGSNSRASL